MLPAGIIRPANSPSYFPLLNETIICGSPMDCEEYLALNAKIKSDLWQLLYIEEFF